jgi:hypothetical protein
MEVYTLIVIQTVFQFDASQRVDFKNLHHFIPVFYYYKWDQEEIEPVCKLQLT